MRPAAGAARVVGTCYWCQLPVRAVHKARVADPAVLTRDGRPIMRLVHAGECESSLRTRIQPLPLEGLKP